MYCNLWPVPSWFERPLLQPTSCTNLHRVAECRGAAPMALGQKNLGKARILFEAYHPVPWRRWMKVSARQVCLYAASHSQVSQVGTKAWDSLRLKICSSIQRKGRKSSGVMMCIDVPTQFYYFSPFWQGNFANAAGREGRGSQGEGTGIFGSDYYLNLYNLL